MLLCNNKFNETCSRFSQSQNVRVLQSGHDLKELSQKITLVNNSEGLDMEIPTLTPTAITEQFGMSTRHIFFKKKNAILP